MTLLGLDPGVLVIVVLVTVVGAVVQSLVGLGVGLVAAPVVTIVAPELMPVTLLVLALLMPVVTLWHEHDEIDWRGLAWALPARVPGTVLGVWLVRVSDLGTLGVLVAVVVLLSVLLTWHTVIVPVTPYTLSGAGFVSGVTGTATSIGGPPMALLYQHRSPAQVRSTLAVYFLVGALLSLGALALTGHVDGHAAAVGLALVPALVLGMLVARVVRRRVDPSSVRTGVLLVCAASAVVLLVRSLG